MDIGLFLLPVGELEYLEIEKTIIRKCYDSEKYIQKTKELCKMRRPEAIDRHGDCKQFGILMDGKQES